MRGIPETTNKMGLAAWDQPLDIYNYQQFANNWNIVDFHDHTPGRGVQIPYGGIAPGAVSRINLASDISTIATGQITMWAGSITTPPAGYLFCDGAVYTIIAYSALYNVIGAAFANSPPGGSFNVPNLTLQTPSYGTLSWIIKT